MNFNDTILAQQKVIERMTKTIREDLKIQKYENYIQNIKNNIIYMYKYFIFVIFGTIIVFIL